MNFTEFAPPVERNTVLNPKIWDSNRMKSEVRGALLRIAKDFKNFLDVPVEVLDVVITGGNANYNYTAKSDIDLHLIADFSQVSCDREVEELFDTKRLLYKRDHDITIGNIPVELYVENNDQPAVSAGVYSVLHGKWIKEPNSDQPKYDEQEVERMVKIWHSVIQHATQTGDLQTCRNAVKLLRTYRKLGLADSGEFSVPNLVYKSLRNDDTVKGITVLIDRLHDQQLSLK
jgi:hypothetical protein